MILFPESSASRFSEIGHRCTHSKERPTHGGTVPRGTQIHLYRNAPHRGLGAASVQYWRWRGQASKDVPVAEEQSSKGLDPETSRPDAFSTYAKLGGDRFGTCCGWAVLSTET